MQQSMEAGRTSVDTELERLGDEIAELASHLHAGTYRLLVRLREFDQREGWGGGFRSCAHWLSWRTRIGPGASREKVRVARALGELPLVSEAMRRGELSYAIVRALTRIATAGNEAHLLELARHATAAQVETFVRAWRRVDRLEEQAEEEKRHRNRTSRCTRTTMAPTWCAAASNLKSARCSSVRSRLRGRCSCAGTPGRVATFPPNRWSRPRRGSDVPTPSVWSPSARWRAG
jgi:hypothetical protein